MNIRTTLAAAAFALAAVLPLSAAESLPEVPREFRAAWVATVANIDWPTKPGLSTEEQKAEAIAILDKTADMNMNAIVLQVRPAADALYPSKLEPWSYYLTGQQGKAPEPYYDPLEFWVDEAHARGIELHCWFNPYRAGHPTQKGEFSDDSVQKTKPQIVRQLASKGFFWMDPAMKETQDHSIAVVMDVVNRYDVDGIHFDDYFYPYPSYNDGADFPDDESWAAYQASGGTMERGDWRREAVNDFVHRLYDEIKDAKPHVMLGISPFGIARPGKPREIKGFDQYATLYADTEKWLDEGWVDYFTPQLYWNINQVPQSFPLLLGWWVQNNPHDRHIWPGLYTSRFGTPGDDRYNIEELENQILITRGMPGATGHVHFSMKAFMNNPEELAARIADKLYSEAALVPASPWLGDDEPGQPAVTATANEAANQVVVSWKPEDKDEAFLYLVQMKRGGDWDHRIVSGSSDSVTLPLRRTKVVTEASNQGLDTKETEVIGDPIGLVAVSAVSRNGIQGEAVLAEVKAE
ncbi:MAG: family 10 glycosylhydrolase [Sumerlaeia bacterium]